jgi:hypothetical protein
MAAVVLGAWTVQENNVPLYTTVLTGVKGNI